MVKSNYATDTNVSLILIGVSDDISAGLLAYALGAADVWVESNIDPVSKTSTPAMVMQAAEYYTAATILRMLYDVSVEDSPQVIMYEKRAIDLLGSYAQSIADEDSGLHPYSSSKTPSHRYTDRVLRDTQDPDEWEHHYVDDDDFGVDR